MEQESIGAKGAQEEGRQDENTSDISAADTTQGLSGAVEARTEGASSLCFECVRALLVFVRAKHARRKPAKHARTQIKGARKARIHIQEAEQAVERGLNGGNYLSRHC